MTKYIPVFMCGFLFNSVLLRITGKIPNDDIHFAIILFIISIALSINYIKE